MREAQGLSLEQVRSSTRIQTKYLQALEDEDFSALPEQVFTKGFIRVYARSLGLDEQDVLRRFSEASHEFYHRGQQEQHRVQTRREEEERGKNNRNLIIVVTAAILIGLAFLLTRETETPPPQPLETTASPLDLSPSTTPEETEVPADIEISSEPEVNPEPNPVAATPTPPPVDLPTLTPPTESPTPASSSQPVTSGPLLMELEATQLTWVVVKLDGNQPQESLLRPGQRATWEATNQFTLTLGDAGGVRVRVNGESRGPFGKQGEVVRNVVLRN